MSEDVAHRRNSDSPPRWQPLEAVDRRVLGVLVEKAKTTPDNYPLSLNALRSGCNQKSNRFPQMELEDDAVEEALERLRKLGAASVIQGDGRVDKYRHLAYDWLGVDKVELAVMAELLLRGAQTVGELRGRAARMETIKGLEELRPILDRLQSAGLLLYLTSKGRGAVVAHALYQPHELDKIRREYPECPVGEKAADLPPARHPPAPSAARTVPASTGTTDAELREELRQLRVEVASLRTQLAQTVSDLHASHDSIRSNLDELNRQLGN